MSETKGSPQMISRVKETAGKGWSSLRDFAKSDKNKELVHRGWNKLRKIARRERQPDLSKELAGMDILQVLQDGIVSAKEIRANSPVLLPVAGSDTKAAFAQDQAEKATDAKIVDKRIGEFKKLPAFFASLLKPQENAVWSNNRLSIIAPERKHSGQNLESLNQGYDYPSKELIQVVLKSLGGISTEEKIDHVLEVAKKAAEKQPLSEAEKTLIISSQVDAYGHRQINLPSLIPGSTLNLDISPASSAWPQDQGRDAFIIELFLGKQAQNHLIRTSGSDQAKPQAEYRESLLEAI